MRPKGKKRGSVCMTETEAFLNALRDWQAESLAKIQDFQGLIFMLCCALGMESLEPSEQVLKARINELVENQGLEEDLLIMGLVNKTSHLLERNLIGHGETIILHQRAISQLESTSFAQKKLEELLSPGYGVLATRELDIWEGIVATRFGRLPRREWEDQRLFDSIKRLKWPKAVAESLRDITMEEMTDAGISLDELKNYTPEQARNLRKAIIERR
jgi:hypothetical protein